MTSITRRQIRVHLAVVAWGIEGAASRLGIQPRTVQNYVRELYDNLGVQNRTSAVIRLFPYIGHLYVLPMDWDAPYVALWPFAIDQSTIEAITEASKSWRQDP